MALNWNWGGYGMNAEQIAEARLIAACEDVFGRGTLPTPALIHAVIAEMLKGGAITGSGNAADGPSVVSPEMFGALPGTPDVTRDGPAIIAAFAALAAKGGGTLQLSRKYYVDASLNLAQDVNQNFTVLGRSPNAGFYHNTDTILANQSSIMSFGSQSAPYGAQNIRFIGVTFSGNGVNDYTRLIECGNMKNVWFDNCRFLNNACEGLYLSGQNHCANFFVTNCYAENVGQGVQKLSAYNLNSDTCLLANSTAINCGQAIEQDGRNCRILGNHIENCAFAGALILSTWASWLDPFDGVTVHTSNNVVIVGNTFINMGTAISTGDSTGHLDHTTQVPGNGGAVLVTGNTFIRCSQIWSGGADQFHVLVIRANYMEDALTAQTAVIDCQKGRVFIEDNTIFLGPTSAWAFLFKVGDRDPVNTVGTIRRNTIIGTCWTTSAIVVGPDVTVGYNDFDAVNNGTRSYLRWDGSDAGNDGPLSDVTFNTDAWYVKTDPYLWLSNVVQSNIRVNGAFPAKWTWKVGDIATNTTGTGVAAWRCSTSGTNDTIKAGCTITTVATTPGFTCTAHLGYITKYQVITIAGVTGAFRILTYDPTTGIGTLSSNADASVTNGAVAFSPAVWTPVNSNDAALMTIASQATGDLLFASSGAAFARRAIGTSGQTLCVVGGVPAWISAFPRRANVNASTTLTVAYADDSPIVQVTCTGATPVITVASIPSGATMIMDVFQDGTVRNPSYAQTGMGSLVVANGGTQPTLTPTINKSDRYAFWNDGTRVVMWVIWTNL